MTLDQLLAAARAEPEPTRANRQFWRELERQLAIFFARYSYDTRNELVQRTLLIVLRKIDRYQPTDPDSLRRWVRVIAANEARHNRLRAARLRWVESKVLRAVPMRPGLTPSHQLLALERAELVDVALSRMSASEQATLEVLDYRDIAQAENITLQAARMRLHRAIRKLAKLIADMRKTGRVRVITSS